MKQLPAWYKEQAAHYTPRILTIQVAFVDHKDTSGPVETPHQL